MKVLLYSGGMDSFCMDYIYNPDILLYVNMGTEDGERERGNLPYKDPRLITFNLPLGVIELKNKIIPFRNYFLVLIAANFGEEIYIGATKGDTTKDKDYVFKSQSESILNYFALDKYKVNVQEYPFVVNMPFKNLTKTEILGLYIKKGGNVDKFLLYSRSCYNGEVKECGKCRSCIRKAVALKINKINYEKIFMIDPLKNISQEMENKFMERESEKDDFIRALSL